MPKLSFGTDDLRVALGAEAAGLKAIAPAANLASLLFPQFHTPPEELATAFVASAGKFVRSAQENIKRHGALIADVSPLLNDYSGGEAAGLIMCFLDNLGSPIRVFSNNPSHWRVLDVDLSRPPNRSRGTGHLPLHMDFVNAENPPDLMCLLSLRVDPLGGGQTIIAPLDGVEDDLSELDLHTLGQRKFANGFVKDLDNIGGDANPFAVIDLGATWRYRYTAQLLDGAEGLERTALEHLASSIERSSINFLLQPGTILVLDQHRFLHGRTELGDGQATVPPSRRREALLSFLRRRL